MMARIEKWDEVHGNQAPDEKMMAFLDSATAVSYTHLTLPTT